MKATAEKLFEHIEKKEAFCNKCGKKLFARAVRMGFYGDIIRVYSCACQKEEKIYRGSNAEEKKEIIGILGEKSLETIRRKQSAAAAALIKCPKCGATMKYMESEIRKNGKFVHRFDCRNRECEDFERSIWIELTEKDCENIFKRAKEDGKCKICGKLHGAKVLCSKEKGFVCEEHCLKCEFHDERGSRSHCRYNFEKNTINKNHLKTAL